MADPRLIDLFRSADYDADELLLQERDAWAREVLSRKFEHRCHQFNIEIDLLKSGLIAGPVHLWVESGSPTTETPSGARTVAQAFVDIHARAVELLGSKAEGLAKQTYDQRYDAKRVQHQRELLELELAIVKEKRGSVAVKALDEVGIRLDLNSPNPSYAVGFIAEDYDPAMVQPTARSDESTDPRIYTLTEDVQKDAELSFTKRYRFSIHGRYIHVIPPITKQIILTIENEDLRNESDEFIKAKERADQRSKELATNELVEEMNNFHFNESLVADIVPTLNESMLRQARQMVGSEMNIGTNLEGYIIRR